MAKKSRRARKKGKRRRPPVPPVVAPTPDAITARPPVRSETVSKAAKPTVQQRQIDFAEQYSYVRQDLRRIALLAGSIFTVLIILSLVLK